MITCTELDDRLHELLYKSPPPKGKIYNTVTYEDLLTFTTDLHTLLLQEGFDAMYPPSGHRYSQHILVHIGWGVRVVVRRDGWVYADKSYGIPPIITGTSIQALVDSLHAAVRKVPGKGYCGTCHYYSNPGEYSHAFFYCGLGAGPVLDCIHHISRTNNQAL